MVGAEVAELAVGDEHDDAGDDGRDGPPRTAAPRLRSGSVSEEAVHVGVDAPFNKLIGPGLHGPPSDEDKLALAEIEREFDARAAPLQVELATLAGALQRLGVMQA